MTKKRLTNKQIALKLREFELYLKDKYKFQFEEKKRDWEKYEREYMQKVRKAMKQFAPIIEAVTKNIVVYRERGRRPELAVKQKLTLLLTKQLMQKSNRLMSNMLLLFSLLAGIDVSYKTVERLYSDDETNIALYNLHIFLLKKKSVSKVKGSGDATGYALTIKKNYESYAKKLKEKSKVQEKKKDFIYAFKILDLSTGMYICYGTSRKSEKDAYGKALKMLSKMGEDIDLEIEDIRIDRYYSNPSDVKLLSQFIGKIYIIPKRGAKLGHGDAWLEAMRSFVDDTMRHLREYYLRNNSESGFAQDKKLTGWKVEQKRDDRIDTSIFTKTLWHNLFSLYL